MSKCRLEHKEQTHVKFESKYIFIIHTVAFQNVVYQTLTILSQLQCVDRSKTKPCLQAAPWSPECDIWFTPIKCVFVLFWCGSIISFNRFVRGFYRFSIDTFGTLGSSLIHELFRGSIKWFPKGQLYSRSLLLPLTVRILPYLFTKWICERKKWHI